MCLLNLNTIISIGSDLYLTAESVIFTRKLCLLTPKLFVPLSAPTFTSTWTNTGLRHDEQMKLNCTVYTYPLLRESGSYRSDWSLFVFIFVIF